MAVISYNKKHALILGFTLLTGFLLWKRKRVSIYARRFLGYEEIRGNVGFQDPVFQHKMENVGWKKGDAWCVYFCKVIWVDKFKKVSDLLKNLISGNSQDTFYRFSHDKSGLFKINDKPKVSDIVIWRKHDSNGNALNHGHAGIVVRVLGSTFWTIEGNVPAGKNSDSTSPANISDGYTIEQKKHSLSEANRRSGNRLRGFIHYKYAN